MAFNFHDIGIEWNCSVRASAHRLGEVHDYWQADATRGNLKELDFFKHASLIAFWLRRYLPIHSTSFGKGMDDVTSRDQDFFLQYGNEICALRIGLDLCSYYEFYTWNVLQIGLDAPLETIRSYGLGHENIMDYAKILKDKNISPYALYLLYRSLFTQEKAGVSGV
jgi:hypothetical protein